MKDYKDKETLNILPPLNEGEYKVIITLLEESGYSSCRELAKKIEEKTIKQKNYEEEN